MELVPIKMDSQIANQSYMTYVPKTKSETSQASVSTQLIVHPNAMVATVQWSKTTEFASARTQ